MAVKLCCLQPERYLLDIISRLHENDSRAKESNFSPVKVLPYLGVFPEHLNEGKNS